MCDLQFHYCSGVGGGGGGGRWEIWINNNQTGKNNKLVFIQKLKDILKKVLKSSHIVNNTLAKSCPMHTTLISTCLCWGNSNTRCSSPKSRQRARLQTLCWETNTPQQLKFFLSLQGFTETNSTYHQLHQYYGIHKESTQTEPISTQTSASTAGS